MPSYSLQYFNLKALGESARLLFSYGNQPFNDIRVEMEDWPAIKNSTPFGQMPVLTIDGRQFSESTPISRYLGKLYGLSGSNPIEELEIDMNVDYLHDIRTKAAYAFNEKNETLQKAKYEEIKSGLHEMLTKLDGIIAKNNGYMALGKLTWGDFFLAGLLDFLKLMARIPDFDKKYPNIIKAAKTVEAIPQVKQYIDRRPKTDF